eukprot:6903820-Heterocapsa_arctica.AAC.1
MPSTIAEVDVSLFPGGNIRKPSGILSHAFRHGHREIEPFNRGGWFKVSDLYTTKARFTPRELYTIAMTNDKQRFQLAVLT